MRHLMLRLYIATFLAVVAPSAPAQFASGGTPVNLQGRLDGLTAIAAEGMEWVKLDEMGVAIQVPDGWHRNNKRGAQFRTTAFSPKELNSSGSFHVGVTVALLWDKQGNTDPVRVLYDLFQGIKANPRNSVIRDTFQEVNGRGTVIVRYRNAPDGEAPIIVHKMLIADRSDRVVWAFTFESPAAEWEEQWKLGEKIMSRVYLPVVVQR